MAEGLAHIYIYIHLVNRLNRVVNLVLKLYRRSGEAFRSLEPIVFSYSDDLRNKREPCQKRCRMHLLQKAIYNFHLGISDVKTTSRVCGDFA